MYSPSRSFNSDKMIATPRTPASRIRQHFNLVPLSHPDDSDDDTTEALQDLIAQTWNIWGVSSMFGFQDQSERQLKLYGKRLREELASIMPRDDVTYNVKFNIDESITPRPNSTDPPAIRIEVFAQISDKPEQEKCVYTGILLSWGTSLVHLDYDKSIKLPLLLCKGTKNTMKAVHTTLGNMFDCSIVALSATEEDLKWLVPVILTSTTKSKKKGNNQVQFVYKIPGCENSDSITVKFESPALVELWSKVCDSEDSDEHEQMDTVFLLQHVEKFYEILYHQMLHGAGLQLGLCQLMKINIPSLIIMDNRMKAATSEVLHKVLLFFNEKAIKTLHTLSLHSTTSTSS